LNCHRFSDVARSKAMLTGKLSLQPAAIDVGSGSLPPLLDRHG
jgi:hypothetical protein